jgi:hypothetical protein
VGYTQVNTDIAVPVLTGDNTEFKLVFVLIYSVDDPSIVRYFVEPLVYAIDPTNVPVELLAKSVIVEPEDGYELLF